MPGIFLSPVVMFLMKIWNKLNTPAVKLLELNVIMNALELKWKLERVGMNIGTRSNDKKQQSTCIGMDT